MEDGGSAQATLGHANAAGLARAAVSAVSSMVAQQQVHAHLMRLEKTKLQASQTTDRCGVWRGVLADPLAACFLLADPKP